MYTNVHQCTQADQQHIFQRFSPVSQRRQAVGSQRKGGVGLGMSICKYLVELMQGRISPPPTLVYIGVHWCTLVYIGVHWCTMVYIGTGRHRKSGTLVDLSCHTRR